MEPKPVLFAFVARQCIGGWWDNYELMPLDEAEEKVAEKTGYHLLIDPHTEIALGAWERSQLPHNKPRMWFGSSGE